MKKTIVTISSIIVSTLFSAAKAQPAVTVPSLESKPASSPQTQVETTVPSLTPSSSASNSTKRASIRKTISRPQHDELNGFKYPPARAAAKKSTAWANARNSMVSLGAGGRVNVIYGQSVPKIGCAYLRVCSVELEQGEVVNKVDAGDPVRWSITPSIVGEGSNKTVHVIIKPKSDEPGLFTNVKIATNRRMYDLDIFSVTGENFVRRIGFSYPENDQRAWEAQQLAMAKEEELVTAHTALSIDKLNFNYSIEGSYQHRPIRVFDDSEKTYIQMGLNFRTQEAPVLVLIGSNGKEQLVNYRLKNGYYMVDKIFNKAALIVGVGRNQQKVTITRKCAQSTIFGGCME